MNASLRIVLPRITIKKRALSSAQLLGHCNVAITIRLDQTYVLHDLVDCPEKNVIHQENIQNKLKAVINAEFN